jgi:hypothetical protein
MTRTTILLCVFVMWKTPYFTDGPYVPRGTYTTLRDCQVYAGQYNDKWLDKYHAICLPGAINPNH